MTAPRFGYGTNGFVHHRLGDALRVIADLGYTGVALTLDHRHLDPFSSTLAADVAGLAEDLDLLGLAVVVETGARFLLDPWDEDAPTLLHADNEPRLDLLLLALDIAADLGAEAVSFRSGATPPTVPDAVAWGRLVDACARLADAAAEVRVPLGFEPSPGMLVADLDGYDRLRHRLGDPEFFGLTLDIGRRSSAPERVGPNLVTVRIDVLRDGGTDFPPVRAALDEVAHRGLVVLESPRHSHAAPTAARDSLAFLSGAASGPDHPRRGSLTRVPDPPVHPTLDIPATGGEPDPSEVDSVTGLRSVPPLHGKG